jgi:hypothetical protein
MCPSDRLICTELTLAASEPYSDSVSMITACKSTRPQLWRAFATARAPMSSTSEKTSVSMIMGFGSSILETQLAVANDKTRSANHFIDGKGIGALVKLELQTDKGASL